MSSRAADVIADADARVAVVLGSGLSQVAATLTGFDPIDYAAVGLPETSVTGHRGSLYLGEVGGVRTAIFAGRAHLYEGRTVDEVAAIVRAAVGGGCATVILTNAAGGIRTDLEPGSLCLISDHLNLTGHNPLAGPSDAARFVDVTALYDPELRSVAREVDASLPEGVYAGVLGPSYETPAEIRMLATLGADLVGMSTVLEAIQAHALGARVLGISVVTNRAAGLTREPLSHAEVAEAGRLASARVGDLLNALVPRVAT